ncbi:MAG: DUF2085 domain-containing protein [Methanomassiliicoccus sp.]|nr:MAG: DUF2085 domain-containing protein [Methanomassiliicoccus sp.]
MRPMSAERLMTLLLVVMAISLTSIVVSPLTLPESSVPDLSGSIGVVDNWKELQNVPMPQRIVYLIGDVNCHQQLSRSYVLNDNQMPVCARDLGILIGLMTGVSLYMGVRRKVSWSVLALFLVPMALDGGLQAISDYESSNPLRTLTGALAGLALGWGAGILIDHYYRGGDVPERSSEGSSQQ